MRLSFGNQIVGKVSGLGLGNSPLWASVRLSSCPPILLSSCPPVLLSPCPARLDSNFGTFCVRLAHFTSLRGLQFSKRKGQKNDAACHASPLGKAHSTPQCAQLWTCGWAMYMCMSWPLSSRALRHKRIENGSFSGPI